MIIYGQREMCNYLQKWACLCRVININKYRVTELKCSVPVKRIGVLKTHFSSSQLEAVFLPPFL